MENFIQKINDLFDFIYDWCAENQKRALTTGGCILAALVLLTTLCWLPRTVAKGTDETHGVSWVVRSNGTLAFKGEGEIVGLDLIYSATDDSSVSVEPEWYAYRDDVLKIDISKEITHVSMDSFVDFNALEKLIVHGEQTELDIECVRYESEEGWEGFYDLVVFAREGSPAFNYAEFNGLEFRPL